MIKTTVLFKVSEKPEGVGKIIDEVLTRLEPSIVKLLAELDLLRI